MGHNTVELSKELAPGANVALETNLQVQITYQTSVNSSDDC